MITISEQNVNEIVKNISQKKKNRQMKQCGNKWKKNILLQTKDIQNMSKDETWAFFVKKGFINNNRLKPIDYSKINNKYSGKAIAVIGSGFSGRDLDWNQLHKITTIGINHIIDIYPKLDMLIFQDHRFLRLNKHGLKSYKGLIFASNNNPIHGKFASKRLIPFIPVNDRNGRATLRLQDGLYGRKSTGLCAVNLALILGADPVYLIGLDSPKNWRNEMNVKEGIHIRKEYKGSVNTV